MHAHNHPRSANISRSTSETQTTLALCLDGHGNVTVNTGFGMGDTAQYTPIYAARLLGHRADVVVATKFGFRTVWINRSNMPDEYFDLGPSLILPSLESL